MFRYIQFTLAIGQRSSENRAGEPISIRSDRIESVTPEYHQEDSNCVVTTLSGEHWTLFHSYDEAMKKIREAFK